MAHCVDFFQKWKKERNFCGMGDLHSKKLDRYMDFVKELTEFFGLSEEDCYNFFPSSALFNCGLLGLKKECPLRQAVMLKVKNNIENHVYISQVEIRSWTGVKNWTDEFVKENCKPLAANSFKSGMMRKLDAITRASTASSDNPPCTLGDAKDQELTQRIRNISHFSSRGQMDILEKMVNRDKAKDIYDAFCVALSWADEKLDKDFAVDTEENSQESDLIVTGMYVQQIRPDAGRQMFGNGVVIARHGEICDVRNNGKHHKILAACLGIVPGPVSDKKTDQTEQAVEKKGAQV